MRSGRWPSVPRSLLVLLALLGAPAAADARAIRLATSSEVHSVAVGGSRAVAVVDTGDIDNPFALVRSSGSGREVLSRFGGRNAEFPAVAAAPGGGAYVTWGVPISGGARVTVAPVDDVRDALPQFEATGPAHIAVRSGAAVLAFPDRDGNAAVSTLPFSGESRGKRPEPRALSTNAPERRHLPMGVAHGEQGTLVLDLVQERDRTELRVIGSGAPAAPILSVPLLRHVPAKLAVSGDRIAVGYLRNGRSYVATARLGGSWSRRTLPGSDGEGSPAPMYRGSALQVAYAARVRGGFAISQRDVFLWSGGRARRLTRTQGDEREVHAAAGGGRAFAAWTRKEKTGAKSGFLQRVR